MDEFILYIRVILGVIFLSSGYSKIGNFNEHLIKIKDYNFLAFLPEAMLKGISIIVSSLEICIGILLFLGYVKLIVSVVSVGLLGVYIYLIMRNLIRGHTDISCGCGGILGDYKISWKLVIRNIAFIYFIIFIYGHGSLLEIINKNSFVIILIALFSLLLGKLTLYILEIYRSINKFIGGVGK